MFSEYDLSHLPIESPCLLVLATLSYLLQSVREGDSVGGFEVHALDEHESADLDPALLGVATPPAEFGHGINRVLEAFEAHRT